MLELLIAMAAATSPVPPAVPTSGASATTTSEATPPAPEPPLVCRRVAETGSHVRAQKVCRTAAEWRRVQADERDAFGDARETNRGRGRND